MNFRKITIVIFATLILGGCVAQWQAVTNQNQLVTQAGTQVELPVGWVSIEVNKKFTLASIDGPGLNALSIESIPLSDIQKELKTGVNSDMDMLEASKKYLAYWSKKSGISDFDIVHEDFVEIKGQGHYVVKWTFKDDNGTTLSNIAQGTVRGEKIVNIEFRAPSIHYFERHQAQVKSIFASVTYI